MVRETLHSKNGISGPFSRDFRCERRDELFEGYGADSGRASGRRRELPAIHGASALRFDALKRAEGASKLGDHHYLPVVHNHGNKVGRQQKILLALLGLVLARMQGLRPAVGLIAHEPESRLGKVRLDEPLW